MNQNIASMRYYLALLLLAATPKLMAQAAANPAPAASEESNDDAITLDPFSVSASEDSGGYQVKDTLAGTRVRTELKDVGSAVSVVNEQFMKDISATKSEDLLKYTTGTEVGGTAGNFSGVGNSRAVGENAQLLKPNANTRVRGLTAADNTRDFFLSDIPWDSYNVGRVDIQRGPNSILFGMGSPAGIINSSLNEASLKDANKVEFRTDDQGSYRTVLDANKVLLKKQLAVRFSALSDRTYYRQKPAYSFDKRYYGALRFDPAFLKKNGMATSLKVNYENGDIKSNRPRSLTPADQITPWFTQMGRKLYNPNSEIWPVNGTGTDKKFLKDGSLNPNYQPWVGAYGNVYGNVISMYGYGATTPTGLQDLEAKTYWGLDKDGNRDGGVAGVPFSRMGGVKTYTDYMTFIGDPLANVGAYKDKRLSDKDVGLFDFYNNLLDGENKKEWRGFEAANVRLSQTFFDNRVGIEGAYDKQRYHDGQTNGVNQTIYVDINKNFLDGRLNPNAGSAFVQSDNNGSEYYTNSEAARFTGFGELRASDFFGRNLATTLVGRQVFTGMYAQERKTTKGLEFLRYAMDNAYSSAISGDGDKHYTLDGNERNVTVVSYLSKSLTGLSGANQAHLGSVSGSMVPSYNGSIYRYDSTWKMETNPTKPGYVNPGDVWVPPADREGAVQADNPDNYKGWGTYPVSQYWDYENGDANKLYHKGVKSFRKVKSQAFVWQGYLLDDNLVPTVGWRRDEYLGANANAPLNVDRQISNLNWDYASTDFKDTAAESISYSIVAHTPKFIKAKMPLESNVSLFFNRSSNIQPRPTDKDMTGAQMANPDGKTTDYGFIVSTLNDRLNLKVNWYETEVHTDRLQGFDFWRCSQTATLWLVNARRVMEKDPANDWKWSADKTTGTTNPTTQAVFDKGAQLVTDAFTNDPLLSSWLKNWGYSDWLKTEKWSDSSTPAGIAASTDTVSKGIEFELNYKPVPNWDVSVNVAKTRATQQNIGGALKEWVEKMDTLANSQAGDLRDWWAGSTGTMRDFWNQNVKSQFNLLKLKEGSNVAELRPWRVNLVSNYNFRTGLVKGVNVGAAYRWEAPVEIGYPVIKNTAGDYVYDVANPYKGASESHVDLWVGYGHAITKKIDWRIQLNLKNVLAKKELIPVSVNPDGSGAAYRLPELTSWQLTNTLTF